MSESAENPAGVPGPGAAPHAYLHPRVAPTTQPTPSLFVQGPAIICATLGTSNAWVAVGTTEAEVRGQIRGEFEEVMIDANGRVPGDMSYMGTNIYVSGTFTRLIMNYWLAMVTRLRNLSTGGPGNLPAGSIGSLMQTEGNTFGLCVVGPYASKAVYSSANMPQGFYIPNAYLDADAEFPFGTRMSRYPFVFRGLPSPAIDGSETIYSFTLPAGVSTLMAQNGGPFGGGSLP